MRRWKGIGLSGILQGNKGRTTMGQKEKITYCYCLTAMEVIVESRSERAWALYGNGMHFVAYNNGRYIDIF